MTITVFVADGCPHSAALVRDLNRRRVRFRLIDLSREPDQLQVLAAVTRERCVPVVVDHERCSVGFGGGCTPLARLVGERPAILCAEGGGKRE